MSVFGSPVPSHLAHWPLQRQPQPGVGQAKRRVSYAYASFGITWLPDADMQLLVLPSKNPQIPPDSLSV